MRPHPVVAITGASAGIGRATALRLARDGAAVVVSARRRDRLDALVREITAANGQALAVVADVTHEEDMRQLVQRSVDRFERLDVMICNAGFGVEGSADDVVERAHAKAHRRQLSRHVPAPRAPPCRSSGGKGPGT